MQKLVSVIITSYRIFQFIYEAIDSVLCQSYGAIELIISDDGSAYFPKEKIAEYIQENKRRNIRNVLIHHEKVNMGTVKNINRAVRMAHGDYIGFLAADDAYCDEKVLERFVLGFEHMDGKKECTLELAQAVMCDHTLKRIDGYALFQNVREAVEKGGTELFDLTAYSECLPIVSFFYKKEFFDKFGDLDEEFYLIEDYPMHLRLIREGYQIHYENFAAVRHRNGGISRGNVGGLTKSAYWYHLDILKIREKYVKPYYGMLSKEAAQDVRDKAWTEERWTKEQVMLYDKDPKLRRQYWREYRWSIVKEWICRSWQKQMSIASGMFMIGIFMIVVLHMSGTLLSSSSSIKLFWSWKDMWDWSTWVNDIAWIIAACGLICGLCGCIGKLMSKIESFPENVDKF